MMNPSRTKGLTWKSERSEKARPSSGAAQD
jgi:hypothetical protein